MSALVVTADDFGLCAPIDRAVCTLHERGVVQRTSVLANGARFAESIETLRSRPGLEVAVHLNLTDGRPVLPAQQVPSLLGRDGAFIGGRHYGVLARLLSGRIARDEVRKEWRAQIRRLREAGIGIRDLNAHGHLHLLPALRTVVVDLLGEFGIPSVRLVRSVDSLRGAILTPWSHGLAGAIRRAGLRVSSPARVLGLRAHGWLSEQSLLREFGRPRAGLTELIVHPSDGGNAYHRLWRYEGEREMRILLGPRVAPLLREAASEGP